MWRLRLSCVGRVRAYCAQGCFVPRPAAIEPACSWRAVHASAMCRCRDGADDGKLSTVEAAVRQGTALLEAEDVPEAEESAAYLMAAVVSPRDATLAALDGMASQPVSTSDWKRYQELLQRRLQREPVQGILGEWDFHGLRNMAVRLPVLIPRPETEELVELVCEAVRARPRQNAPLRILDIGCGSGAIAVSLLKEFSHATAVAVDVSNDAVSLTTENSERFGVSDRLTVVHSAIQTVDWSKVPSLSGPPFDVIVSNPPYIPTPTMDTLEPEVADYEDSRALDGGPAGLNVVWDIFAALAPIPIDNGVGTAQGGSLLRPDGLGLWLELDDWHPDAIRNSADMRRRYPHLALEEADVFADLQGKQRFCRIAARGDIEPARGLLADEEC